ncbi:MAG: hypothetical protein HKN82_12435 [Akkermansiaceae bacterium]|nr:hypothetical protein [Akkermansiaceae bacterium]
MLFATPARIAARESYGDWTGESIIKYSMRYITNLKERFAKRAAVLGEVTGRPHDLGYQYFHGELDRKQERHQERFLENRLSERDMEEHIANLLEDLEAVRKELAAAEKKAREDAPQAAGRKAVPLKKAEIYGTTVSASRLGVILDNSPSMAPHLEKLRETIGAHYPDAHYREVWGSFITGSSRRRDESGRFRWFYVEPGEGADPLDPEWHCPAVEQRAAHKLQWRMEKDNVSALLALVQLRKADAIYWFCDFDDDEDDEAIKEIARPILDNKVRLYVHTLKRRPPKLLILLIERSGGELVRARP